MYEVAGAIALGRRTSWHASSVHGTKEDNMSQAESELNQSDMPAVEGSSPQPPTGEVPQTSQGSARAPTHGATRQQKKAPAKPNKTAQGPTPGVTAEALEGRLRSFRDEVGQQLQELGASIRDIIREEISRGIAAHPEQAPGAQGVAGTVIGRVLEDEYNRALEGVPIQLLNRGGQDFNKTEQSDANGAYCFDDVPPGDYNIKLEKEKITLKDGDWVSGENSKTEYHITVQESTPTRVPMFRLARDEHKIWGYLRTPNGSPLSGATIPTTSL